MCLSVIVEDTAMLKRAPYDGDVVTAVEKGVPEIRQLCAPNKVVVIKEKNIVVELRVRAMKDIEGNEYVGMMVNFQCFFWSCYYGTKIRSLWYNDQLTSSVYDLDSL